MKNRNICVAVPVHPVTRTDGFVIRVRSYNQTAFRVYQLTSHDVPRANFSWYWSEESLEMSRR
jgi:hypothetical protein